MHICVKLYSVHLADSIIEDLKSFSEETGVTVADHIRTAIYRYLLTDTVQRHKEQTEIKRIVENKVLDSQLTAYLAAVNRSRAVFKEKKLTKDELVAEFRLWLRSQNIHPRDSKQFDESFVRSLIAIFSRWFTGNIANHPGEENYRIQKIRDEREWAEHDRKSFRSPK